MRLTSHVLRIWADDHHIPDLALAELDYRLTQTLDAIYGDPFLRERLYLKGGTALNKLFFPAVNRLSLDLDFNAVGPKAQVLAERAQLANQVMTLLADQDAGYALAHDYRRYEQSTIRADFAPVSGGPRQHLKLEISFIERVPILGREQRPLASPDGATATLINTYRLEELTATKLRALYGRRKGRDIYDLTQIAGIDLDERDRGFLHLARYLLGGSTSEHEAERLAQIEHPIAWLMEGCSITAEAAALRQDDIHLFGSA